MKCILTLLLCMSCLLSFGQTDTPKITFEADTLFSKMLASIPQEMHQEFTAEYRKMSVDQRKVMVEFVEMFAAMPSSSKKQLTQNIDTNYLNILAVKTFFKKLVPKGYAIYIEFKPPEQILNRGESIDFWVFRKGKKTGDNDMVFQEWNIELNSDRLDTLLNFTTLKRKDLQELKAYLDKANCISVSNEDEFEIGYARSGMGKYSYLIFDSPLSKEDQKEYNNGCEYIFYKDNIVLAYGGGAIGPQCFPDRE